MIRHRIVRGFIFLIAFAIGNDATVSTHNPTITPHTATATSASFIHIGVQTAYAERCSKRIFICTCVLYPDYMECSDSSDESQGRWVGMVRSSFFTHRPWFAELKANDMCEKEIQNVNCKHCRCSNPC